MPQFMIDIGKITDGTVIIEGKDAKHISNVLRLKKGDWLMLTDGRGNRFKAEITASTPKKISAVILSKETPTATDSKITLAQAVVKNDKFSLIVQKATELGCGTIIPFVSERINIKPSLNTDRFQKIADEAAKQCGTLIRPLVKEVTDFERVIQNVSGRTILFYEGESSVKLSDVNISKNENITLIIGPEGGFAKKEIESAKNNRVIICSLGPLILRVETAAIAAMALVQQKIGYFEQTPFK